MTLFFFLLSTSLLFADDKCALDILISNQSFERPNERIAFYLDGQLLFDDVLPVRDQHYVKDLLSMVEANKRHWIRVIAKDSHIESGLTFEISEKAYLYIVYTYDKAGDIAGFQFNLNDKAIGID